VKATAALIGDCLFYCRGFARQNKYPRVGAESGTGVYVKKREAVLSSLFTRA
jgi:hypothetical protein